MNAATLICPPRQASLHAASSLELTSDDRRDQALSDFEAACRRAAPAGERQSLLREATRLTPHGAKSNSLEHGQDIADRFDELRTQLATIENQRTDTTGSHAELPDFPDWLRDHGRALMAKSLQLADPATIREYLEHHDCGKPATLTRDADGRLHFPGHAQASAEMWARAGGSPLACRLMEMDMILHTANAEESKAFALQEPLAPLLLLCAWCEIESNAESVFGGRDSTSYKIKRKALERRARAIISIALS